MEFSKSGQIFELLILALPIAAVAWSVTHEEIFREAHDWCVNASKSCDKLYQRKFFYLFTCEYCFSHWVAAAFLVLSRFRMLFEDWRGYVIALFSLVWCANFYMAIFARLRLDIKKERVEISEKERELKTE